MPLIKWSCKSNDSEVWHLSLKWLENRALKCWNVKKKIKAPYNVLSPTQAQMVPSSRKPWPCNWRESAYYEDTRRDSRIISADYQRALKIALYPVGDTWSCSPEVSLDHVNQVPGGPWPALESEPWGPGLKRCHWFKSCVMSGWAETQQLTLAALFYFTTFCSRSTLPCLQRPLVSQPTVLSRCSLTWKYPINRDMPGRRISHALEKTRWNSCISLHSLYTCLSSGLSRLSFSLSFSLSLSLTCHINVLRGAIISLCWLLDFTIELRLPPSESWDPQETAET